MLTLALLNRKKNSLKGCKELTKLLGGMEYHIPGNTARSIAPNHVTELIQRGPHNYHPLALQLPHLLQPQVPSTLLQELLIEPKASVLDWQNLGQMLCPTCKGDWKVGIGSLRSRSGGWTLYPLRLTGRAFKHWMDKANVKCPLQRAYKAKRTNRAKTLKASACLGSSNEMITALLRVYI